jgi:hypothetical protein
MEDLDGNAIGGLMHEIFGVEMTTAVEICGHCGNAALVAETAVYLRGPGAVMRCPTCTSVLMVVVSRQDMHCVDLLGLASLTQAGQGA